MKTEHTSGPWKADAYGVITGGEKGLTSICETYVGKLAHWAATTPSIENAQHFNSMCEEAKANTALIAAAPELLAMCQNSLEALEGLSESNAHMSEFERACIPSLKAIIAKAKGQP